MSDRCEKEMLLLNIIDTQEKLSMALKIVFTIIVIILKELNFFLNLFVAYICL